MEIKDDFNNIRHSSITLIKYSYSGLLSEMEWYIYLKTFIAIFEFGKFNFKLFKKKYYVIFILSTQTYN